MGHSEMCTINVWIYIIYNDWDCAQLWLKYNKKNKIVIFNEQIEIIIMLINNNYIILKLYLVTRTTVMNYDTMTYNKTFLVIENYNKYIDNI